MGQITRYIMIFLGILFIIWGLWQVQTGKIDHGVGTQSFPIETQTATPGSIIVVHTTSDNTTETRVVKLENRKAFFQNGTLVDTHLVAGGRDEGGRGKDVELWAHSPSLTDTKYLIVVLDDEGTTDNISNINYTVEYTIWMPNFLLLMIGIFLMLNAILLGAIAKLRSREVAVDVRDREPAPERRRAPEPERRRAPAVMPTPSPRERRAPRPPPEEEYYDEGEEEEYYPPGRREPEPEPEPEIIREPEPAPRKPVGRIRCSACGEIIPLYSKERPMRVTCPSCGRSGTLR